MTAMTTHCKAQSDSCAVIVVACAGLLE